MKRGHLSIADAQRKLQLGGGQELSSTQAHRQADLVGLFDVTPASTNVAQNSNAKAKAKVEVDIFGDPIRPPPGSSTSPPFPPPAEERGGGPVSAGPHSSSFSSMFTARRPSSSSAPVGDTIMGIHHVMSHSQYPDNADNRTASATASNYPNAEVVRHSEPPTRIDFFQVSEISNTAAKPSTGTIQTSPFDSTSCSIDMIFGSGSNNNFSAPAPPLTSAGNGAFGWPQFSQAPQQLIQPVQPVVSCNPFDAIPLNYNSTGKVALSNVLRTCHIFLLMVSLPLFRNAFTTQSFSQCLCVAPCYGICRLPNRSATVLPTSPPWSAKLLGRHFFSAA